MNFLFYSSRRERLRLPRNWAIRFVRTSFARKSVVQTSWSSLVPADGEVPLSPFSAWLLSLAVPQFVTFVSQSILSERKSPKMSPQIPPSQVPCHLMIQRLLDSCDLPRQLQQTQSWTDQHHHLSLRLVARPLSQPKCSSRNE